MTSVDKQIENNLAAKKAKIKKTLLGIVVLSLLFVGGAFLYKMMPLVSGDAITHAEASSPNNKTENQALSTIDRTELQKALTETKQQTDSILTKAAKSAVFQQRAEKVRTKLTQAYQAYGESDYFYTQQLLTEVKTDFSKLKSDYQQAYTTAYQQALRAFSQDNIAAAFELNQQALNVNPEYEDAIRLQKQIDVYEQVQAAYEQARVGSVENNMIKQRDAYAKIVQLDPARDDAKQALDKLNHQIQLARFNELIQQSNRAISNQQYDLAQGYINEAEQLFPGRAEVVTLRHQLNTQLSARKQAQVEQHVKTLVAADDWAGVKMMADKGLSSYPNSNYLLQVQQSASRILDAERTISVYMNAPVRLADSNIRKRAQSAIASFDSERELSPKLNRKLDELNNLIEKVNQPLPITITSDNKTFIKVIGVGIVGETKQKTIQLKPGTYKLEGSRKGYKSKIIDLVVSPSTPSLAVHLACTEQV